MDKIQEAVEFFSTEHFTPMRCPYLKALLDLAKKVLSASGELPEKKESEHLECYEFDGNYCFKHQDCFDEEKEEMHPLMTQGYNLAIDDCTIPYMKVKSKLEELDKKIAEASGEIPELPGASSNEDSIGEFYYYDIDAIKRYSEKCTLALMKQKEESEIAHKEQMKYLDKYHTDNISANYVRKDKLPSVEEIKVELKKCFDSFFHQVHFYQEIKNWYEQGIHKAAQAIDERIRK